MLSSRPATFFKPYKDGLSLNPITPDSLKQLGATEKTIANVIGVLAEIIAQAASVGLL